MPRVIRRFLKESQPEPQFTLIFFIIDCYPDALRPGDVLLPG